MPYLEKIRTYATDKVIEYQNEIETARQMDVDLSDAQEIFSELKLKMQKAMVIADFKEIIDYAAAGRRALERASRRKQRFDSQAKEYQEQLDLIITDFEGLKTYCAIPSSVEKLIQQVRDDIEAGKFETAKDGTNQCKTKLEKLRHGSEPKLDLKIQEETLQPNLWNRAKLKVANKGLASASNINIRFSGPLEVRRIPVIETLEYNKKTILEIGLKPEGAGSLPIDVDIDYIRTLDRKTYQEHQEFWLEVSPTVQPPTIAPTAFVSDTSRPDKTAVQAKSGSGVNCLYCNRKLEKAAPIFKCSCGTIYHLECITNLVECLNCNANIKEQVGSVATAKTPASKVKDMDWK